MASHFVGLPSGRRVNLDLVVVLGKLRWEPSLHQDPEPALSLILPGGGANQSDGPGAVPVEVVIYGDDALALWWQLRQIPALDVPQEARDAADKLHPRHMQPEAKRTPTPPPFDDTRPDQPF